MYEQYRFFLLMVVPIVIFMAIVPPFYQQQPNSYPLAGIDSGYPLVGISALKSTVTALSCSQEQMG